VNVLFFQHQVSLRVIFKNRQKIESLKNYVEGIFLIFNRLRGSETLH